MPITTLKTKQARAAAVRRDQERNVARIDVQIEARLSELARQHGLHKPSDADALVRAATVDEQVKDLVVRRFITERVGPVLAAKGYVPALTNSGEVVWRKPEKARCRIS